MTTLLEKAKKQEPYKFNEITEEVIDLFIAFVKGDISLNQCGKALGQSANSLVYTRGLRALKEAYKRGYIKFTK